MMRNAARRRLLCVLLLMGIGPLLFSQTAVALTYQVDQPSGGWGGFSPLNFSVGLHAGSIGLEGALEDGAILRVSALDLQGSLLIGASCPPTCSGIGPFDGSPIRIALAPGDPNQLTLRREGDLLLWSGRIGLVMSGLRDLGDGAPPTGADVHAILVVGERSPAFFEGTLPDVIGRPNFIASDGFRLDGFVQIDPRGDSLLDGLGYIQIHAVPEPSTALLAIGALLGLAIRGRTGAIAPDRNCTRTATARDQTR